METFAPVAKINTVCILLSLAVNLNWPLHQFDVKNSFFMEISKKKCIWSCPMAVIGKLKVINKSVGCENPYMV